MFCKNCGSECSDNAAQCPKCGEPLKSGVGKSTKSRMVYILLGFFLSPLGIHDFYIGRYWRGFAYLAYNILVGWLLFTLLLDPVIWLIEAIFTTKDGHGNRLS